MTTGDATVQIRAATIADVPDLAGVQLRSALAGFAHIFPASIPEPTQVDLEAEWSLLAAHRERTILLGVIDGDPVGAVVFGADLVDGTGTDSVLLKLYIVPDHAGRGIGSMLHDRAMAALAAAGYRRARLWVLERNLVARRMYERRGWILQRWSRSDFPGSGILEVGYSLELPIRP